MLAPTEPAHPFLQRPPMRITRRVQLAASACMVALLLAACGGGSGGGAPIQRVVVAGDSLADVGTFGMKFTVQNAAAPAAGFPIYPQLVAREYGINSQCNFYVFTGASFAPNSTAGCTNYAIAGGRVVIPAAEGGSASPLSIPTQLATAGANVGSYGRRDMLIVDGGGNDAADLVGSFLGAAGGGAGAVAYRSFLLQQIDAPTLDALLAQPNGGGQAAGLYMQRLANTFYAAIKTHALDRGARFVVVLNMPDITLTPRFRAVLAGVAAANGGGAAGAAAAAQLKGAIQQWIRAFNTQLATRIGSDDRVVLVDFFAEFTAQVANPDDFGLTNATDAACPVVGVDAQGLPRYDFPTCTSAALNAAPPAGASAGWWTTFAFSDGFHPTPRGHQLLADAIERALRGAGWL
jgi:outer membrane lipase/esterase